MFDAFDVPETRGFQEAVEQSVGAFLCSHGFRCVHCAPREMTYHSGTIEIRLIYAPNSCEIDTYLRPLKTVLSPPQRSDWSFDLGDVATHFAGDGKPRSVFYAASTRERIELCMEGILDLLGQYGKDMFAATRIDFAAISTRTLQRNAAYHTAMVNKPIRLAAQEAWQNNDYARAKKLYKSLGKDRTSLEEKRLDYARRHGTPSKDA